MDRHPHPEELFDFPCDFMFKAFGPNDELFPVAVRAAVEEVISVPLDALRLRQSGKGTYVCVSILVRLQAYSQVQAIYASLRRVDGLKYLL
ncbi:MAG: DUF493 domain-containing protein [Desulfuromonadales bacterium]|nr:DUF493 domain-containing protein [Desulfuromonadales bacterium]